MGEISRAEAFEDLEASVPKRVKEERDPNGQRSALTVALLTDIAVSLRVVAEWGRGGL